MASAAGSSNKHERSCSHIPTFSARHPMIPKLYVMPWRQDMKNQRLLLQNAAQAAVPVVSLEESLCLDGRERLCHGQNATQRSSSSSSSSSSSALLSQTALNSSHLSRYNSSVVTTRQLYHN